ncbi:MAG TPA: protein kinase [Anaeromyxobacter sp.]|nr:protein kinase [Anaeromyxobacter sp.]
MSLQGPPAALRDGDEPAPGAITALLRELVAAPEESTGAGWEALQAGAVVGRFELVREVGRGGFGVVWEARDRELGRRVAFKAVRAGRRAQLREERLHVEAEAAARLNHPNLVTLYDVGRTEQGPYLVYEFLEGQTLARRLARGPLPVREVLRLAVEIARGMAHAHARGLVHRDLKPGNVMLCADGQVKVLDFGMAHAFGWTLAAGGTPAYMAPEQAADSSQDERTDVFAMGVMLYEMLERRLPFGAARGDGRSQVWPAAVSVPDAPALGVLVDRMLAPDPEKRPRDGAAVLSAFQAIQGGLAGGKRDRKPIGFGRRLATGLIVALLLGTGLEEAVRRHVLSAGPTLVAVADFANETSDPELDGLSGLLITSLEQSRSLRVLTRGRMIELLREMGKGDSARIDEPLAQAVGRKARVRALFLASIHRLGTVYATELRALDPQRQEYLFTIRDEAASKDEILPAIDRLSQRAREALREPAAAVRSSQVSVAEAVTPSLEAYRHYFRGKDLAARGLLAEATREYQSAVETAPAFSMAKLEIAWIGYLSGSRSRAAAAELVHQASLVRGRAPDKEARLIEALGAFFAGRFASSRAGLHALLDRYPEDGDVAVIAAEVLTWSGEVEGALPVYERAFRLEPDWEVLRVDQIQNLYYVGRRQEALAITEAAVRERPTPLTWMAAGLARYLAGDVEGGIQAFRTSGGGIDLIPLFLAQGLAAQGSVPDALGSLATMEDSLGEVSRAQVLAYGGRLREGLAAMERAAHLPGTDVAFNRQATSWYLAAAGELEAARRTIAQGDFFTVLDAPAMALIGDRSRLSALLDEVGADTGFQGRFLRALSAVAAGDRASALTQLRSLDRATTSLVPYFHGLVAAQEGQDQEAVDCFTRFERPVLYAADGYYAPWLQARARYLRARSLERLGRRDEARAMLDAQLERWAQGDPELLLQGQMKELRAALSASPP